jgi:hypothetical protein
MVLSDFSSILIVKNLLFAHFAFSFGHALHWYIHLCTIWNRDRREHDHSASRIATRDDWLLALVPPSSSVAGVAGAGGTASVRRGPDNAAGRASREY